MQFYLSINQQPLNLLSLCAQIQRGCKNLVFEQVHQLTFLWFSDTTWKQDTFSLDFLLFVDDIYLMFYFWPNFTRHSLLARLWHISVDIVTDWYSKKIVASYPPEIILQLTRQHFYWLKHQQWRLQRCCGCGNGLPNNERWHNSICLSDRMWQDSNRNVSDGRKVWAFFQLPICNFKIGTLTWIGYSRQQALTVGVQRCWDTINLLTSFDWSW